MKIKNTLSIWILILSFCTNSIGQVWEDCDTIRTYLIEFNDDPSTNSITKFEQGINNVADQTNIPIKNLGVTVFDFNDYDTYFPVIEMDDVFPILLGIEEIYPAELQEELQRIESIVRPDIIFFEAPVIAFGAASSPTSLPQIKRVIFSGHNENGIQYPYLVGHTLLHKLGIFDHELGFPNLMYWGEDSSMFGLNMTPGHISQVSEIYRDYIFDENPHRDCNVVSSDYIDNNKVILSPNPVSNLLNIITPQAIKKIKIYNAYGIAIFNHQNFFSENINLSDLPRGVYYVNLEDQQGSIYKSKFIKI